MGRKLLRISSAESIQDSTGFEAVVEGTTEKAVVVNTAILAEESFREGIGEEGVARLEGDEEGNTAILVVKSVAEEGRLVAEEGRSVAEEGPSVAEEGISGDGLSVDPLKLVGGRIVVVELSVSDIPNISSTSSVVIAARFILACPWLSHEVRLKAEKATKNTPTARSRAIAETRQMEKHFPTFGE